MLLILWGSTCSINNVILNNVNYFVFHQIFILNIFWRDVLKLCGVRSVLNIPRKRKERNRTSQVSFFLSLQNIFNAKSRKEKSNLHYLILQLSQTHKILMHKIVILKFYRDKLHEYRDQFISVETINIV